MTDRRSSTDALPTDALGRGARENEALAASSLAQRQDFPLGDALIRPSRRTIEGPGGPATTEPRVMQVLLALFDADGAVLTRDDLLHRCWGGAIVGDDAIHRAIGELRRAVQRSQASFAIETIPRIGYRLKIEPHQATASAKIRRPRSAVRIAAFGGIALVVAGLLAWGLKHGSSPAENGRVEVQNFRVLQPDKALERVATASTEAAVRQLTETGAVVEPTRPGVKGAGAAEFSLLGSVDRVGRNYVVNAQMRDQESGLILWSGRIIRPEQHAFTADVELGGRVAGFVRCALRDRASARRRLSPEVFGMMLNACDAALIGDHARMLDVTRRLVEQAPDLASAHAMHALAQAALAQRPQQTEGERQGLRAGARRAAEHALKLNPGLAKAYLARGMSYRGSRNWGTQEPDYLKALELEPDLLPARASYSGLLREVGRTAEAREMDERLVEADPRAGTMLANLARDAAAQGDLPLAYGVVDKLEAAAPQSARATRSEIAVWWDTPQAGRQALQEMTTEWSAAEIACLDAYLANLRVPRQGLPSACASAPVDRRIRMLAREGDIEGAIKLLGASPTPPIQLRFLYDPELAPVRADPRFWTIAERLGLANYWRSTGRRPDFCSDPALRNACEHALQTASSERRR